MKKRLILLILVVLVILIAINYKNILKITYKTSYSEYVEKYAKEYSVDPLLIYAIIKAESNFNSSALSSKGACGLMQIMDNTAREVAENNVMEYESGVTLYNAEKNIQIGVAYFSSLLKEFGNVNVVLAAYNAGSGNVSSWIKNGTIKSDGSDIENVHFKETNMYIRKINRDYKIYKMLYNWCWFTQSTK